jgi:tetratricopeptide (TPR) repeat protein
MDNVHRSLVAASHNSHGSLIAYLKSRVQSDPPEDYSIKESLFNAFKVSGLYDEAIAYWEEMSRIGKSDSFLYWLGEALMNVLGESQKALEFWQLRCEIQKKHFFVPEVLKEGKYRPQVIEICKSQLRKDPSDYEAAESLQELAGADHWDNETRLKFWKGVLRTGGEYNPVAVSEVRVCFAETMNLEQEIQFWKAMVINYPDADEIVDQACCALIGQGDDNTSFRFWGKMVRKHPTTGKFAYYFAEAASLSGNVKTAVKTWKLWLELFLSGEMIYSSNDYCGEHGYRIPAIVDL